MFKRLKQWLGIEEKPEIKFNVEEKPVRPVDEDRVKVVGVDDPAVEELINRVWNTGKAHVGNRREDGTLEIKEINE